LDLKTVRKGSVATLPTAVWAGGREDVMWKGGEKPCQARCSKTRKAKQECDSFTVVLFPRSPRGSGIFIPAPLKFAT
jgi:hypothetical protein